jgi:hypothetical protein
MAPALKNDLSQNILPNLLSLNYNGDHLPTT